MSATDQPDLTLGEEDPSDTAEDATDSPKTAESPSLGDKKLDREIQKLDLEIDKLTNEIAESKKPYLWRNPQVLPTAIAALGAIVGLGIGFYSNYFTTIKDKAAFEKDKADSAHLIVMKEVVDSKAARDQAQNELKQAAKEKIDAEDTKGRAESDRTAAQKELAEAKRRAAEAAQITLKAKRAKAEAELTQSDAVRKIAAAQAEVESAKFERPLNTFVERGRLARPEEWLVSPLIKALKEGGPLKETRVNTIGEIIKKADTPAALKASLMYVLLKGDQQLSRMDDLGQLVESAVRSGVDVAH